MDQNDKKILECLSTKDSPLGFSALAHETGIAGEVLDIKINPKSELVQKDWVRFIWPASNPKFAQITESGRRSLWTTKKRMTVWFFENWLLITSTIAAIIAAVTGIISLWISFKSF